MNCPKCKAQMESIPVCGVEIDRCLRCKGIWFDRQEQGQVEAALGSYKADTGHPAIGEYYNAIRTIQCPRCSVLMPEEEITRGRRKIQIETCSKCHGSYFDAGEFRDFTEPTILEFAVELFARLQRRFFRKP